MKPSTVQNTNLTTPSIALDFILQVRKSYDLNGQGNAVGNGTSISRGEKNQKIHLPPLRKRFLDHTGTFYYDLRKEEHIIIDLALKMAMKGMSEEAIARCIGDRASYRTFKAAFMFKPHIIKLRLFHNCLYRNYPYRENLELKA